MKDESARKVYVQVEVDFSPEGQMRPRELIWEDGTRYEIDRILDVKQAAELKCGGQGADTLSWFEERKGICFLNAMDLSPGEILDAGLFPAPVWRAKITSSDQKLHIRILRDNSPGVFFLQYKENRNKFQINRSSGFH